MYHKCICQVRLSHLRYSEKNYSFLFSSTFFCDFCLLVFFTCLLAQDLTLELNIPGLSTFKHDARQGQEQVIVVLRRWASHLS